MRKAQALNGSASPSVGAPGHNDQNGVIALKTAPATNVLHQKQQQQQEQQHQSSKSNGLGLLVFTAGRRRS
ncbi:unnamed protein product [Lampetra planeri]